MSDFTRRHRMLAGVGVADLGAAGWLCFWLLWGTTQVSAQPPAIEIPPVTVVAPATVPDAGLDAEKVPYQAQTLDRRAISRTGPPDALGALSDQVAGVHLDQAQENPYQPNLFYHGFEASPLVGTPQGLAVYVNGSRFNQPFGDTMNWDLVPDIAINQIDILDANPVFGLNALGGSISIQLKNGFNYQGGELILFGGSFGRTAGSVQYGRQAGGTAAFAAAQIANDSGWRDHSPSHLRQFYGDIGWRADGAELHLALLAADNTLVGNGSTPVDLLAVDRAAVFTYPDQTRNKYARIQASGSFDLSPDSNLSVSAYYSNLSQRTANGDAAQSETCDDNPAIVCQEDGPPLRNAVTGALISSDPFRNSPYFTQYGLRKFRNGGPFALLNQTGTDTNGYGLQVQANRRDTIFGMENHLIVGASYDGGSSEFTASSLLGGLSLDRGFIGPGIPITSADGAISPVRVHAFNNYYGVYASDTLDVTSRLSATLSGRYNVADIDLRDRRGDELSGRHHYAHFNPAFGISYKVGPSVAVYAGWSMANRTPTPAELSCADPQLPCSLTNFFVADPNLKQVVAQTFTAGTKGTYKFDADNAITWQLGAFRTVSNDDILFVSSPTIGRAFFRNIGDTLRQGIDAIVRYQSERWQAYANYAFIDATFQSDLVLNSENNPAADANGNIFVRKNDRLPGIPAHLFKFGGDVKLTQRWIVGLSSLVASGQYLVGDGSNQNRKTDPYVVTNFHTSYQLADSLQLFGLVNNIFNADYTTYGTFAPVNSNTPILQALNSRNTRSLSPGTPIAGYAGMKLRF